MNGRLVSKLLQTLGETDSSLNMSWHCSHSLRDLTHTLRQFRAKCPPAKFVWFGSTGLRTVAILRLSVNGDFPVYVTVFATGRFAAYVSPEPLTHWPRVDLCLGRQELVDAKVMRRSGEDLGGVDELDF